MKKTNQNRTIKIWGEKSQSAYLMHHSQVQELINKISYQELVMLQLLGCVLGGLIGILTIFVH